MMEFKQIFTFVTFIIGDFPDREELFFPPDHIVKYSPPLNIPLSERPLVISNTHQPDPISPTLHLSLYLSSLRFTHHALFSQEHILCTTLYSLQLQYGRMREAESAEMSYRRLQALRRQLRSLRAELDRLMLRSLTGLCEIFVRMTIGAELFEI